MEQIGSAVEQDIGIFVSQSVEMLQHMVRRIADNVIHDISTKMAKNPETLNQFIRIKDLDGALSKYIVLFDSVIDRCRLAINSTQDKNKMLAAISDLKTTLQSSLKTAFSGVGITVEIHPYGASAFHDRSFDEERYFNKSGAINSLLSRIESAIDCSDETF